MATNSRIFPGAREDELGQLRVKDVRAETFYDDEGNKCTWPFLHIVEDKHDGLKLKNQASERYVPQGANMALFDAWALAMALHQEEDVATASGAPSPSVAGTYCSTRR